MESFPVIDALALEASIAAESFLEEKRAVDNLRAILRIRRKALRKARKEFQESVIKLTQSFGIDYWYWDSKSGRNLPQVN